MSRETSTLHCPRQPQQPFKLLAVEPDNHFIIDQRHGSGKYPKLRELVERRLTLSNIPFVERDPVLRKPRFLQIAEMSTWLAV